MSQKTFASVAPKPENTEPGTAAHCRRVAAWSEEVARALRLPPGEIAALSHAALSHHWPDLMNSPGFSRMLTELGLGGTLLESGGSASLADEVLAAFHNSAGAGERAAELAKLLDAANCLDEQLEYAPFLDGSAPDDSAWTHETVQYMVNQLRVASISDLRSVLPRLPVYPAAAMRLFRLMASDEICLDALEAAARMDQVIAGRLLAAANSAYYSPRQPIRTVTQAITFLGTNDARRILLASSIQSLFSSPRMRRLWKHALEAAQAAERIAILSGKVDPAEAFLLGLLHDVGKLAISLMSTEVNDSIERLLSKGCQPITAETVLCGFDHATAGAEALRHWKFPEELVTAVNDHHQPERTSSRLSGVLYLTEFWTDSEEDLPSHARLTAALNLTDLTAEALDSELLGNRGALMSL